MSYRFDWKLRRIASGFRQQDVAARIGVTNTRYSALERGKAEARDWESEAIEKLLPAITDIIASGGRNQRQN
jgi:transcriptional regulator with XRE-family HTH domain